MLCNISGTFADFPQRACNQLPGFGYPGTHLNKKAKHKACFEVGTQRPSAEKAAIRNLTATSIDSQSLLYIL